MCNFKQTKPGRFHSFGYFVVSHTGEQGDKNLCRRLVSWVLPTCYFLVSYSVGLYFHYKNEQKGSLLRKSIHQKFQQLEHLPVSQPQCQLSKTPRQCFSGPTLGKAGHEERQMWLCLQPRQYKGTLNNWLATSCGLLSPQNVGPHYQLQGKTFSPIMIESGCVRTHPGPTGPSGDGDGKVNFGLLHTG